MKNIALVYGGFSKEAEISEKSAYQAKNALANSAYHIFPIFISKEKWVYKTDSGAEFPVDKNDFSITVEGKKIIFDKALNLIHGAPGENGVLGSYFSLIGLPYTSSGVLTSALTMNKNWTTRFLKESGITVPASFVVYRGDESAEYLPKAKYPCFVKPNNGGSSVGTSKAKNETELIKALEIAFQHDDEIIVEEFIQGREFTCGVMGFDG
ncbi:MAG: D-alanine--D-alanine ligase family protein, partial [Flavobacteriales bacterium]